MGFQLILTYFYKLSHKNNFSKKFRLAYILPNSEKYDKYVVDCMTITREYCSCPVSIYPTLYSVSQTGESISLWCSCHENSIFSVTIVIFFVLFITFWDWGHIFNIQYFLFIWQLGLTQVSIYSPILLSSVPVG